eukprot:gnl/MRDRNA2_/MRDRNA2_53658_c0_seq1.p1 gnl/MRDRNA2_/MRDRNA2_53658_c0~~gnl/MRDRNA2_/MRDRNA2_53658_c0_seq1.p1  ORF type:complete len:312 (-),score=38.88 gnl/MRDRNA2_/MRDRNA2_53658_c0_seq1:162-1028(-)
MSGVGSEHEACKPFMIFLSGWLAENNVSSILEVSCGHWPSGWQRFMEWPNINYVGIDLIEGVVQEDLQLFESRSDCFGFAQAHFVIGDMILDDLPASDVLLTKDTLIHFPNQAINRFLQRNVLCQPPRFKHILFVHDCEAPDSKIVRENNTDISRFGEFHPLDLTAEPFSVEGISTIFSWVANRRKVVQYLQPSVKEGCAISSAVVLVPKVWTFNGEWARKKHPAEKVAVISGGICRWISNNAKRKLFVRDGSVNCEIGDERFNLSLVDGALHWSDGDVWIRCQQVIN